MPVNHLVSRSLSRREFTVAGLGALSLAVAALAGCTAKEEGKQAPAFETVKLGSYAQAAGDGAKPQAIEWYVLETRDDGSKLLLCRDCIERFAYNDEWVETSWEGCSLRAWLNGEFLQTAFTDQERARIMQTELSNDSNPRHGTEGGATTVDSVFLLSIEEVETYQGEELLGQGFPQMSARPSARVAEQGAYANEGRDGIVWWLRSPGSDRLHAAQVNSNGEVFLPGTRVDDTNLGVRPALVLGK